MGVCKCLHVKDSCIYVQMYLSVGSLESSEKIKNNVSMNVVKEVRRIMRVPVCAC